MDYAAAIWWTGGESSAHRKWELVQMSMNRRLLKASGSIAGVAVQADLGWRKLEERREEMKMMFGRDWGCWKREDWWK